MALSNADVLRGYFRTFEAGGVDAAAEFWLPEIEWRAVGRGAADDVGVIRGRDALRRYYEDWQESLADLRGEVEEILYEADDRIAAVIHSSGRGRASGVPTRGRYYLACIIRDGRIAVGSEYDTRDEALEAVRRS